MNARRKILLLAIAFSPVLLIGASCSFPDVSFSPAGAPESGTSDSPTGSDGPVTGDAAAVGANEDVNPTGATRDASTVPEGGGHIEAGPGCCDCDNDQVMADGGTCAKPARDCDDLNPYIFPGQGPVSSTVWNTSWTPTYDWDCDGVVLKQYNHSLGACNTHSRVLDTCANHQGGFVDDPPCGTTGHFVVTCANDPTPLSTGCVETAGVDRVQGCQ